MGGRDRANTVVQGTGSGCPRPGKQVAPRPAKQLPCARQSPVCAPHVPPQAAGAQGQRRRGEGHRDSLQSQGWQGRGDAPLGRRRRQPHRPRAHLAGQGAHGTHHSAGLTLLQRCPLPDCCPPCAGAVLLSSSRHCAMVLPSASSSSSWPSLDSLFRHACPPAPPARRRRLRRPPPQPPLRPPLPSSSPPAAPPPSLAGRAACPPRPRSVAGSAFMLPSARPTPAAPLCCSGKHEIKHEGQGGSLLLSVAAA